jgi:hypothetical protein
MPVAFTPRTTAGHNEGVQCYIRRGGQLVAVLRSPRATETRVLLASAPVPSTTYHADFAPTPRGHQLSAAHRVAERSTYGDFAKPTVPRRLPLHRKAPEPPVAGPPIPRRSVAHAAHRRLVLPHGADGKLRVVPVGFDNSGVQRLEYQSDVLRRSVTTARPRRCTF